MKEILIKSFNKLYYNSPLPNNIPHYLSFLKELYNLEKIQYYSRRELDKYQDFKFRKLIKHAYNDVRFYRIWFKEHNYFPNDFKTVSDIKKLPILTKEIIRKNYSDLISLNSKKYKPKSSMTSGITGIPFKFLLDKRARIKEQASYFRQWRINNIKFTDRIAILRGTLVNKNQNKNSSLYKYYNKSIHFNTFHMNKENCEKIIIKMLEFQPHLLRVYPMALFILSQYIKKYDIEFPKLKMIHFSSESYTQFHRDFIKQQFNCPILDRYGQSEIVLNAFECKPENGYHIEEENNIIELLDKNNENVSKGEIGRIVGTNLHNYSMPLIRYSTEDLAIKGSNDCSCGRHTKKLNSIQGRILDQIITEDKSVISGISFYHYWKHRIGEKVKNIRYSQIIQPKIDEIIVIVLPEKAYSKTDENLILKELKILLGNLNINFKYIDKKPDDQKWRFTISKLSNTEVLSNIF